MSFLAPKQAKQESFNSAEGLINKTYTPMMQSGVGANNILSSILGTPGSDPSLGAGALKGYYKEAGFAPALAALQKGVVGGMASKGLLNSGATQNALLKGGANLNNSFFNNFLQQLAGESGLGLQSGQLVSSAGQKSSGTGGGPSTAGSIASTVGGVLSLFSDRRLKRDQTLLSRFKDGLGLWLFRYHDDDELRVGVMADEVEAIRPWALGPLVGGFATVNYGAL